MADNMLVLGIDPGLERLGWALIEKTEGNVKYIDSGVKKTSRGQSHGRRLLEIQEFLEDKIKKTRPDLVSLEKIFFAKNAKTALQIGEVRGVILAAAEKAGVKVQEFTPLEVKMAITGYGRADKSSINSALKWSLKLPDKKITDDEADAIALALSGIYSSKLSTK